MKIMTFSNNHRTVSNRKGRDIKSSTRNITMGGYCLSYGIRMIPFQLIVVFASVSVTTSQDAEETSIQYRMTEENEPQKVLGNVAVDAGLDVRYGADVLDQLRFSFLSQSSRYSEYFSIGERSGLLEATISIDRDELCPRQVNCNIPLDISVQPGQYFQIIKVTVLIEDLNDNSPTFPENPVERSLLEASGPGASLPIPPADDPDSPRYNIKEYRQVSGLEVFDLRVTNNTDGTVDMQLVLKQELDRESNPLYRVQIVASDGDKSGTATVEIEIKDVNDNNPKFDNQTYETFVYENTPMYTTVLKVHARDPDAGRNGEIVYGFTTRTKRAYGDIFNIDETTGEIFVVEILDYEDGDVYILDVTAQDKSDDPLPTIAKVTIHVRDLNDHAPQITVNSEALDGHVEVSEDAQIGDFVAHITVIDPDGGQNGGFTCSLDDNSQFELQQLYKTEFKIISKALFDREQQAVYNVALVCTDKGSTPQASTKRVEIRVADVNDHPPVFMPDFYNAIIQENNKIGAPIIQVNATDRDIGLNGQIRYGLAGIANELFDINPVTGNITAKVILDHELQQSLTITVLARDQGNPQLSASATLLLNVQDIDDEAPKFSQGTYVFGVEENLPAGTFVGQISATDPDSEPFNFFTFSLDQRYNVENAFRIAESTGIIYTTMMLDREAQGVYHLVVIATSTGSGQQNTTNVFVSVLDQNDNAPIIEFPNPFNNTVYVKQNDPAGNIIGYVVAKDNDTEKNKLLTFNITNGDAEHFFAVNKNTGAILVNGNLNGQEDRQFSLVIKVYDNGDPVRSAEAILNIVVNQSLSAGQEGNITSNQNLTIVIAIATVSGFLMVILIIAIVVIIRKQRTNDKRKKKYNYIPKIVKQEADNGAVANGQIASSVANGETKSSGTPKKEVSFKTGLDHNDSFNRSFDVSIEKVDPMAMDYMKAEPGSSRPSFNEGDLRKHGSGRYNSQPQKPWSTAGQFQKPGLHGVAATDKDSDSACSADMSNTDSGRGSNDDGSDNHFRSASPHWDPNSHHKGAASPHASPTKEKPNHRSSSINTKSLQSGVHAPVHQLQYQPPPTYRDLDPTYSQPHLPPRRVPSRSHSHQDSHPAYREHLDTNWNKPVTSSSHELTYRGDMAGYHGNHRHQGPQRTDRQDWKLSGNRGGYYASHV